MIYLFHICEYIYIYVYKSIYGATWGFPKIRDSNIFQDHETTQIYIVYGTSAIVWSEKMRPGGEEGDLLEPGKLVLPDELIYTL